MSIEDSPVKTHTNRLAGENSPYLLSHANNPVDWFPWGDEALEKAKREDKPIFLSIGYAACHWCHVMERESFENEDIAAILNEHFVSIKVDREQRPDLDQIYMTFTTALAGQGGWPMSVFLTPDLKPFFAGTYFPPDDRFGRPGFKRVISEIARAYREEKDAIAASSKDIFEKISEHFTGSAAQRLITNGTVARAADILFRTFDEAKGGFGNAPKFPHSLELSFFLRYYRISGDLTYLNAAEKSLKAMADGGIYDHLAGGFARYSTDPEWLVPHFEKMLYDNALLVPAYAEACQVTGDEFYRDVVINTLDFILNEMTDSNGGFYSTIDADSEGEEGKFYVWKKEEIDGVLGADAEIFNRYYGVTSSGNFEGRNILHVADDADRVKAASNIDDFDNLLDRSRRLLLSSRNKRPRPATDDKILTSWNGLALSAFCKGYQITGDARYLNAAIANATFVRDTLYQDGHLTHAYRQGKHSAGQFLEDYAYYVRGLIDLYQTDHTGKNLEWLTMAAGLASSAIDMFMDNTGRFYLRPDNQSDLIMRPVEETDGATPAPGSIMIGNLLKLNRITDNKTFLDAAEKGLKTISGLIDTYATGMTSALLAADYYLNDKVEIVIVGQDQTRDKMLSLLNARYLPNAVVAFNGNGDNHPPLFDGRLDNTHLTKAYVCRNSVCELPVSTVEDLQRQLGKI